MRLRDGAGIVITGAASGIGAALARECFARGHLVALADVEPGALDAVVAELSDAGGRVISAAVDVADPDSMTDFARFVRDEHGPPDVVVANAGVIGPRRPLWEQQPQDWEWTLGVNLSGVVNTWVPFLADMVERNEGHLVATSSVAGLAPIPQGGNAPYAASKYGVVGLAETLRAELVEHAPNVGITVLCPGPVRTRIRDAARNRPSEFGGPGAAPAPVFAESDDRLEPDEVAAMTLRAVEENHRYLVPNLGSVGPIVAHLRAVAEAVENTVPR
jgi:NAD(P)-dependent dehydrogenase (short-subunit alcohol dehydrogenase family)